MEAVRISPGKSLLLPSRFCVYLFVCVYPLLWRSVLFGLVWEFALEIILFRYLSKTLFGLNCIQWPFSRHSGVESPAYIEAQGLFSFSGYHWIIVWIYKIQVTFCPITSNNIKSIYIFFTGLITTISVFKPLHWVA